MIKNNLNLTPKIYINFFLNDEFDFMYKWFL